MPCATVPSWRLLSPLRSFGTRLPRLARVARRAAKFVWWTLTFQIGHRYLLRRQRWTEAAAAVAVPSVQGVPVAPAGSPELVAAPFEVMLPTTTAPEEATMAQHRDLRVAFEVLHSSTAIHFPPISEPEVSVIIPAYKGLEDLENCLRSLAMSLITEPAFEVILIDDCPAEPVLPAIPYSGGLRRIANADNQGFVRSCNHAATVARGRVLCFLNSDTIVLPGWLGGLVEALDDLPGTALAGGVLLNTDGTIQEAGWRILGNGWGHPIGRGGDPRDGAYTYRRPVDCVSGACFVVARRTFDDLGGFDEAYSPAYYEEFDLAFRARARGLQVICEPKSRVIHLGSTSYGAATRDRLSSAHHALFVQRFAGQLDKQPWDVSDEFTLRHGVLSGPVVLVVDTSLPQPNRHAGDVTMSQYLSLLATAGYRVVFGSMDSIAEGPAADALERQGIELIRHPRSIESWLADHGQHVREVWLARPEVGEKLISSIRAQTKASIAYYPHDLHHLRLQREAALRGDAATRPRGGSGSQAGIGGHWRGGLSDVALGGGGGDRPSYGTGYTGRHSARLFLRTVRHQGARCWSIPAA